MINKQIQISLPSQGKFHIKISKSQVTVHVWNIHSFILTDFVAGPYTEYKIQVAACTNGGQGTFSEKYPALTDVAGKWSFSFELLTFSVHGHTTVPKTGHWKFTHCVKSFGYN